MVLSEITGSRAYERYTGPQIRKLFTTEADLYASTERISLVSSFMASLLIGDYASIDETDGAGMNLMDIKKRCWSKEALQATATGLEEKLGKLAPAYATAGSISQYFVHRFVVSLTLVSSQLVKRRCRIHKLFVVVFVADTVLKRTVWLFSGQETILIVWQVHIQLHKLREMLAHICLFLVI